MTGNFLSGSSCITSVEISDSLVLQASAGVLLITIAQAPQRLCRQLCSQTTGVEARAVATVAPSSVVS